MGNSAFYGCTSLCSIVIPCGLTNFASSAFGGCTVLGDVYYNGTVEEWCAISFADATANPMSNGANLHIKGKCFDKFVVSHVINEIKAYAFYGCKSLVAITVDALPNQVKTIGAFAFAACTNLAEVTFGESLVSIGDGAFYGCTGIKSLHYRGTAEEWNAISKGDEWNYNVGDVEVKFV